MSTISPSLSVPTGMPFLPDDNAGGLAERLLAGAGVHANGAEHGAGATTSAGGSGAGARPSPAAVGKAFEEVFASILVKQMRQSMGEGMFGTDPGDVRGGLFDHFMSQHIAQKGSLGIGKMIEKHMEKRSHGT